MECLIPNVGKRGEFDWRKWKINIFAREKKKSCFPTQSMLLTFILLVIQIVSLLLLLLSLSLSLSLDSRSFNTIRRRSSSSPVQTLGSTLLWNVTQKTIILFKSMRAYVRSKVDLYITASGLHSRVGWILLDAMAKALLSLF